MHRYRRHFELYIGVFQLVTGFLYNFCNALNVNVFLTELQWHGLNNILTTTYFLLLLIHLQANSNPTIDIVLRYAAFTAVWIAQIKDEYWNPKWTGMVVAAFCIMPVCKFGGAMRLPPYDAEKLMQRHPRGRLVGRLLPRRPRRRDRPVPALPRPLAGARRFSALLSGGSWCR